MWRLFLLILLVVNVSSAASAEIILERSLKFGGQLTSGNTQLQSLHFAFYLNKNRQWIDEITAKGSFYDESTAGVKSMLKAFTMFRYAFTFLKKYYNFYRIEFEHDQFKNLDLRIVPTTGVGYWWSDLKDFKLMAEGALGYQREYLQSGAQTGKIILQLRGFLKRMLFKDTMFSEDFYFYSQVEEFSNYRILSESNLTLKLNENWALNFSLLNEYNSQPSTGVGKSDLQFTTSLVYTYMLKLP